MHMSACTLVTQAGATLTHHPNGSFQAGRGAQRLFKLIYQSGAVPEENNILLFLDLVQSGAHARRTRSAV